MLKNRTITADNDKVIADNKSSHEQIAEKTEENVKLDTDYKELEVLIGDFFQDYALNSLVGLWKNEAFTQRRDLRKGDNTKATAQEDAKHAIAHKIAEDKYANIRGGLNVSD